MEPAPAKAKPQGRLLVSTQLDAKDELEEVGGLGDLDPVRSGPVRLSGREAATVPSAIQRRSRD